jgi:pre-mRNA-processing factor 19
MSINTCALTGKILEFPVISRKTGDIFEKESILSHIDRTGQCPITGQELTRDDIIEVKISDNLEIKPRPEFGNVPDVLNRIHNEWDTLILENFHIKKELKEVKDEITHNLYLQESANLVICRLIKERDEALKQLNMFRSQTEELRKQEELENEKEEEFENMGVYEELIDRINDLFGTLSSTRKKREISKELPTAEKIKNYHVRGSYPIHSTTKPGITCLDIHPFYDNLIVTGGVDGKGVLFDHLKESIVFDVDRIHNKKINNAKFYPSRNSIGFILTGADNLATFWLQEENDSQFNEVYRVLQHKNSISSASFHPLGEYCLLSSRDHHWSFHNMLKGVCLTKQKSGTDKEISKCEFHPDGNEYFLLYIYFILIRNHFWNRTK